MKKSVLLVLASAALMMAACGGNKPTPSKSSPVDTSENTSVTSEGTSEESSEESSEEIIYVESLQGVPASVTLEVGDTEALSISVLPAGADQELEFTTTDANVAKVMGGTLVAVGAGTATITVSSHGLKEDGTKATGTIAVTVNKAVTPLPTVIDTDIDAIQDFGSSNENKIYRFSGILEGLSHTDRFGNSYIVDPVSGKNVKIYGLTTTETAIAWNEEETALEYSNPKDAVTTLADVNNGELVTVRGIYSSSFKNVSAILESHEAATTTYSATVTNESGVTLSKSTGLAYGEEVTIGIEVPAEKVIDSVVVNHGYGSENVEAVEGVYKFAAHVVNEVTVTFGEAGAPTGKVSYDLATKGAEFTYVADGTTISTSYKEVAGRIAGVDFNGSRTNYSQNTGTAPWATAGLVCQYLLKGTDSTSTDVSTVYFTVTAGYNFTKASFTVQDWNKDKVAAYLEYSTDGEAWTKDGGAGLEFTGSASDAETHALETADTISAKYVRLVVKPASNVTQGKNDYKGRIGIFGVDLTYPAE